MQKLYFIDCYNGSPIKDLGIVDLRGGKTISFIIDARRVSTEQTDSIYQAKAKITPDFPYYDLIVNDSQGLYGFRYETRENNIAFVIRDKQVSSNGVVELTLKSSIDILNESFSYPDNVSTTDSISTILSNLDNRFIYTLISPDSTIILSTTVKTDYEVLKDILRAKELWVFRENKLISQGAGLWKTEVLIGNFAADIENYYNANPIIRAECKPVKITSLRAFDNPQDVDQVQPDDITGTYPTAYANRIYVFGDNNQGITQNSRTALDPRFITQRPEFPLGSKVVNGKTYYYITNIYMQQMPIREKVLVYQNSDNEQGSSGQQIITQEVSPQKLYQQGCSYIQSLNYLPALKLKEGFIKKFVLPGNIVHTKVKRVLKTQGGSKVIIDVDRKGLLNEADQVDIGIIKN